MKSQSDPCRPEEEKQEVVRIGREGEEKSFMKSLLLVKMLHSLNPSSHHCNVVATTDKYWKMESINT